MIRIVRSSKKELRIKEREKGPPTSNKGPTAITFFCSHLTDKRSHFRFIVLSVVYFNQISISSPGRLLGHRAPILSSETYLGPRNILMIFTLVFVFRLFVPMFDYQKKKSLGGLKCNLRYTTRHLYKPTGLTQTTHEPGIIFVEKTSYNVNICLARFYFFSPAGKFLSLVFLGPKKEKKKNNDAGLAGDKTPLLLLIVHHDLLSYLLNGGPLLSKSKIILHHPPISCYFYNRS